MSTHDDRIAANRLWQVLRRVVDVRKDEVAASLWSFAYFFCVLCSYYILRPVREEMAIQQGVQRLQWGFTGTFVAMVCAVPVFGALVKWFPRRWLLPMVYYFFIINLVVFFFLFQTGWATIHVARAFFIWFNVFNLYVVSVFWSLMADVFRDEQARRLFGFIAAGGSSGAILGPALTAGLAVPLGTPSLLLVAAGFLILAVFCIHRLIQWSAVRRRHRADGELHLPLLTEEDEQLSADEMPIGGGLLTGVRQVFRSPYLLGICLYIWLYTTLSTFLYFEQVHIVGKAIGEPASRTTLFAYIDLAVNILAFLGQVLLMGRVVARWGLAAGLAIVPLLVGVAFVVLGMFPTLVVLVAFQVFQRSGNFAIVRPAREVLFTVVGREEKYKSKNFIDTVVHRGGDMMSSWLFHGLSWIGMSLSGIAFCAIPVAGLWMATGTSLAKKQETLRDQRLAS